MTSISVRSEVTMKAKATTYDRLKEKGLPIPADLKREVEEWRAEGR